MCGDFNLAWAINHCKYQDPSDIIQKLDHLLKDNVAKTMINRHCQMMRNYIRLSSKGIKMKDLQHVISIMEHLGDHLDDTAEYLEILHSLLRLCLSPPILERASEGLFRLKALQEFFTVLGYMIVCVHNENLRFLVIDVIRHQLTRDEPVNLECVKLDLCHLAMERSLLAQTVGEVLELVNWNLYPYLLELAFLITSISNRCCHQMICARAINTILMRLDPDHHSRSNPETDMPEIHNLTHQDKAYIFSMALNILWGLLKSVDQLNDPSHDFPAPSVTSLWSLRYQLRVETCQKNNQRRNDLLGVLIFMLKVFPKIPIVPSGLVEDLAMLSVASEIGTENSWASNVTFETNQENLDFKKLLLISHCFTIQYRAVKEIFISSRLLNGILKLVTPLQTIMTSIWTRKQKWELTMVCLRVLTVIVPEMAETFIEENGHRTILMMIEVYITDPYNEEIILNGMKILSSLAALNNKELIDNLHQMKCIFTLCRFCNHILLLPHLTLMRQDLLMRIFLILEILMQNHLDSQSEYGYSAVMLIISCFNRVLNPKKNDSLIDERLLICAMDFLWEVVIWNPENMKIFVQRGGTYMMLDITEKYNYPVKLISLAALVDLIDQEDCLPHLLTWRGKKQQSYSNMLLDIWRNEEICLGVKRTQKGCVADIELPLMGTNQQSQTFFVKKDPHSSLAILDLLGSSRPKIYAIFQICHQRFSEEMKLIYDTYGVNNSAPTTEDQITLKIVENFLALKIGEVWFEIAQDLHDLGVRLLALDAEVLETLLTHQRNWSLCVQDAQFRILSELYNKEMESEGEFYSKLGESRIHDALDALKELDHIARTTDRTFLLQRKMQQCKQVNESIHFPDGIKNLLSHRTFPSSINVTAICNQKITVCTMLEAELGEKTDLVSIESASCTSPNSDNEECDELASYDCSLNIL